MPRRNDRALRLLSALYAAGARPAAPGEFTRRAVLNGKMDLLQAEAVADLIDATAPAQARAAIGQIDGALSRRLGQLRERLIGLEALLSYDIDFPEEDDGPVAPERIETALVEALDQIDRLVRTAPAGQRLREGALVVIAGAPNAGKSSLFNALLGTRRVLVSEIPGTTRDTVEAYTDFLGWPIRLADTAGLSEFEAPGRPDGSGGEPILYRGGGSGDPLHRGGRNSTRPGAGSGRPGRVLTVRHQVRPGAGPGAENSACLGGNRRRAGSAPLGLRRSSVCLRCGAGGPRTCADPGAPSRRPPPRPQRPQHSASPPGPRGRRGPRFSSRPRSHRRAG